MTRLRTLYDLLSGSYTPYTIAWGKQAHGRYGPVAADDPNATAWSLGGGVQRIWTNQVEATDTMALFHGIAFILHSKSVQSFEEHVAAIHGEYRAKIEALTLVDYASEAIEGRRTGSIIRYAGYQEDGYHDYPINAGVAAEVNEWLSAIGSEKLVRNPIDYSDLREAA